MVTSLPSGVMLTGRSARNSSSSAWEAMPTRRSTSTTTSLAAWVLTSMDPKSTSTTIVPPGCTAKRLLIFSSESAQTATAVASNRTSDSFIVSILHYGCSLSLNDTTRCLDRKKENLGNEHRAIKAELQRTGIGIVELGCASRRMHRRDWAPRCEVRRTFDQIRASRIPSQLPADRPGIVAPEVFQNRWRLRAIRIQAHFLRRGESRGVRHLEYDAIEIAFSIAANGRDHSRRRAIRVHRIGVRMMVVVQDGLPLARELVGTVLGV